MKRPATCALIVPVAGAVAAFAPGAATCFVLIGAIVFGTCVLDSLCSGAREWALSVVRNAHHNHHRRNIKPPANLLSSGVILSVVFVAIGFFWNTVNATVSLMPFRLVMSIVSIAAHFVCLGIFICLLGLLQFAPDFRKTGGIIES